MPSESKASKVEVLPKLQPGQPFNIERLIEEHNQLIEDYNHVHKNGHIPGDNLGVFERRNETLIRMRELAVQLNLVEELSWIEKEMRNYLIPFSK